MSFSNRDEPIVTAVFGHRDYVAGRNADEFFSTRRSRRASAALLVAILSLTSACKSSHKTETSLLPVRVALTNTPLPYLPVFLSDALGFYRREGLSVTIDDFLVHPR